ncbi:hypothetical protein BDW69DRAFT_23602 [Aspergillus filifer]
MYRLITFKGPSLRLRRWTCGVHGQPGCPDRNGVASIIVVNLDSHVMGLRSCCPVADSAALTRARDSGLFTSFGKLREAMESYQDRYRAGSYGKRTLASHDAVLLLRISCAMVPLRKDSHQRHRPPWITPLYESTLFCLFSLLRGQDGMNRDRHRLAMSHRVDRFIKTESQAPPSVVPAASAVGPDWRMRLSGWSLNLSSARS